MKRNEFTQRLENDPRFLEQVIDIVEDNTSYYLSKWKNHPKSLGSWNWAAFFLTPFWLAYRYMYGYVFIYFLMILLPWALSMLLPYLIYYTAFTQISLFLIPSLLTVFISLLFGWKGNAIYAKHVDRFIKKHELELPVPPLFKKKGRSLISGIFVPVITFIFLIIPAYSVESWVDEAIFPEGAYVYDEFIGPPKSIREITQDEVPVFIKYDSSIQLLYHGKSTVGRQPFETSLYYRENEDSDWTLLNERAYSFFSTNQVTLNLIDSGDPLTSQGEYLVEVYIDGNLLGTRRFDIIM